MQTTKKHTHNTHNSALKNPKFVGSLAYLVTEKRTLTLSNDINIIEVKRLKSTPRPVYAIRVNNTEQIKTIGYKKTELQLIDFIHAYKLTAVCFTTILTMPQLIK